METPEHEWDGEASAVVREFGLTIHNARNLVIMDWLTKGDTRALSDWLMRGHIPDSAVMKALAVMLVRGHPDADMKWFDHPDLKETADIFTLRLEIAGKGKRGGDPAISVRNRRIALEVEKAKRTMTEEDAFEYIATWLCTIGYRMTDHSVKKIYNNHKHLIYVTNSDQSVP